MAIARDTYLARTTQTPAATSYTFSYTCTGSNRVLVLFVEHSVTDTINTVTYAGDSMTKVDSITVYGTVVVDSWIIINPASGANNVVSSASASIQQVVMAESYTGTTSGGSTGGCDAHNTATFLVSSLDQSISTTTVSDNAWIPIYFRANGGSYSASTNVSIQDDVAGIALMGDTNGALTPAGSKTQTFTRVSGTNSGGILTVALAPYVASATNSGFFGLM